MDKKVKSFCEENSISIKRFLTSIMPLDEESINQRFRHDMVKGLPQVVVLPLGFCLRYKELVKRGKLMIVKDDYGYFQGYFNPYLIEELKDLEVLKQNLNNTKEEVNKNIILRRIKDIEENKRIIECFNTTDTPVLKRSQIS